MYIYICHLVQPLSVLKFLSWFTIRFIRWFTDNVCVIVITVRVQLGVYDSEYIGRDLFTLKPVDKIVSVSDSPTITFWKKFYRVVVILHVSTVRLHNWSFSVFPYEDDYRVVRHLVHKVWFSVVDAPRLGSNSCPEQFESGIMQICHAPFTI